MLPTICDGLSLNRDCVVEECRQNQRKEKYEDKDDVHVKESSS
jgi:hypothetical protein